eukprot:Amastigsp_a841740_237.p2 type:complete len:196 gc:universal Amastigsp_a841740_237:36-623(+)
MATLNTEPLVLLLKAQSQKVVDELFIQAFRYRIDGMPLSLTTKVAAALQADEAAVKALASSIVNVVLECVYRELAPAEIVALFPAEFNNDLKGLIATIVGAHMGEWRELLQTSTISLPKLVDAEWRVDVKSASQDAFRMHAPTCIVELTVQEEASLAGVMMGTKRVNFEMNRETLETMLDGLGKIRDQLASIKNM